ncbi:Calx-beta domain-containing protein [Arsukibacterium perlucidum]|uniref:Calx-beta domain-containing protein n=1 Tax=Arsukibacterium perlucidum TaxID=368811 RepID=UPI00146ECC6B|nr:Calx-beta domain-containing protein [Arsukibacterium perlucidum]
MHNFKLTALAAATLAITSATVFAQTHQHSASCGHDELNSPVLQQIGQSRFNGAFAKKAAPFADGAVRTMNFSASSDSFIDVIVYVHPSYIDDLSTPIRFDENNKPIENGAQFMHDRVQDQFDKLNAAMEINNVNARYRVAYVHILDVQLPELGNTDALYDEFGEIAQCTTGDWLDFAPEFCNTPVYQAAFDLYSRSGVDTFHYLRSARANGSGIVGLSGFFSGSATYDDYAANVSGMVANGDGQEIIEKYLKQYGSVTIHEVGHVLGANHPDEDFDGKGHQAHFCGELSPGSSLKKRTVMASGETHLFFSDPEVVVQGDACGIAGVADNSDAVRSNAPLLAAVADKPVVSTNFEFTQSSMVVDSGSGKHTFQLQRLGDLSQPVSVNLMAVDNTAWELRDFHFGWQEVLFAADQAYADVEFTALEREGKHPNTQFAVKMMYATAGNLSTEQIQVNIQSTNPPMIGSVSLAQSTNSVMENAGTVTLTINRTNGVDGEAVVSVKTRNQTAIAGTDYTAVDTQLTLADGQESATVMVNIINNSTYQGSRTFALDIVPTTEGLTAGTTTATITITDDEVPPSTGGGSGGAGGGSDTGESSGGSFSFITALFGVMLLMRRKFTNQFHNERK